MNTKVLSLPSPAREAAHRHSVQFYENEELLFETVARFLGAGMLRGERLLVIAHPDHCKGILERLDADAAQLLCLDAGETLAEIMVGDMPDPVRCHAVLGRVLTQLAGNARPARRVRAYGEMVDLLWREGNFNAAIRLEELWNDAGKQQGLDVLGAYLMGHFYKEDNAG